MSSVPESQSDNNVAKRLLNKREKFVRSSSIEKIIRFNTYICSQNYYYILPALLAWLKTSQTILQITVEKTIRFLKSLFYTSLIYRLIESNIRSNRLNFYAIKPQDALIVVKVLLIKSLSPLKDIFFKCAVYTSFLAIFLQLIYCLYSMSLVHLPSGFLFLISCMLITCHMCYQHACNHFKINSTKSKQNKQPNRTSRSEVIPRQRLSRKQILGNRTISTFNLF